MDYWSARVRPLEQVTVPAVVPVTLLGSVDCGAAVAGAVAEAGR